jgi:hypothetical protein
MASYPMAVGAAPPVPPDVQAQMGAGPGVGPIAQQGMAGSGEGTANPNGALFAQAKAVSDVLEQMAQLSNAFAPFARQAVSIIVQGVSAASAAPEQQSLPPELAGTPPGMPSGPPLA